ncbi:MAG: HypC/HybG/HupF family hydrogenase formation chaperone [Phycisphaerae bacterium]
MCLAIPGRILQITDSDPLRTATVDFDGVRREVTLCYVPEARVGDYVLVHVGFAISRVDEDVARETLEALRAMNQLAEIESPTADAAPTTDRAAPDAPPR